MKLDLVIVRLRYVERARSMPRDIEDALRQDSRKEASRILAAVEKIRKENRSEGQRLRHMLRYEQEWLAKGATFIAGVDEAGMSPLAGPVVAGAVILPAGYKLRDLDDSKKVDAETREVLAAIIKRDAIAWSAGIATVAEIETLNIYYAGLLAMRRAVENLSPVPDALLIDARKLKELAIAQQAIIGGDGKSLSIAAASIIAKTTRDGIMRTMDSRYPGYGFATHKGYGVPQHYRALEKLGHCEIHRLSFPIVKRVLAARETSAK